MPCNYRIEFLEYANNAIPAGVNFISYSNIYIHFLFRHLCLWKIRFEICNDEKFYKYFILRDVNGVTLEKIRISKIMNRCWSNVIENMSENDVPLKVSLKNIVRLILKLSKLLLSIRWFSNEATLWKIYAMLYANLELCVLWNSLNFKIQPSWTWFDHA